MTNRRWQAVAVGAVVVTMIAACGAADMDDRNGPDQSGANPAGQPTAGDGCPTGGTGSVRLTITGLPPDLDPVVSIGGVTATGGEFTVDSGPQTVAAELVVGPGDDVLRAAYTALVPVEPICVRDGEATELTVSYDRSPSNLLWTGLDTGDHDVLGFAPDVLSESGDPAATVALSARGRRGLAFDRAGNLWLAGRTTSDPLLLRYPAGALASGDRDAFDLSIRRPQGSNSLESLAFDPRGNLWASMRGGPIVRYSAEQLAAGGEQQPSVEITSLTGRNHLAFDAHGNLWATADELVNRFDAARLSASIDGPPDLTIELASRFTGTLGSVWGMAFDADGGLWTNHLGNVVARLAPGDQTGAGSHTRTPAVEIAVGVNALAETMAFDESGGMWLTLARGRIGRLAPQQLTESRHRGQPILAATIIASPDIGHAGDIALFPAPAGLPLYHSLP